MGNNIVLRNPLFEDWKPIANDPDIYINSKTKKQVRSCVVLLDERDQSILEKRTSESHSYIAKVQYYHKLESYKTSWGKPKEAKYQVFTDAIYPLEPECWTMVDSSLIMLRGFRRLSTSLGFFRVCEEMVRMNEKNEIKVWVNPNPAVCRIWQSADSEERMLADITAIMMKFDSETGSLLAGCHTMNQAMNNILLNLPENRVQSHLSTRTVTIDYKTHKNKNCRDQDPKNVFRSTKETTDQFPKPAKDFDELIGKGLQGSTNKKLASSSMGQNLLHNVQVPKKPIYLQERPPQKNRNPLGYRKLVTESSIGNKNFYSTEINKVEDTSSQPKSIHGDKYKSLQFSTQMNHSHPNDESRNKKASQLFGQQVSKPVSQQPGVSNSNAFLTHYLSPKAHQSRKIADGLFMQSQYYNRKSDLHREHLEKIDDGRPSDFSAIARHQKNTAHFEEQLDYSTAREGPTKNSSVKLNKTGKGENEGVTAHDAARNRTQEFNQMQKNSTSPSWNQFGVHSRYLTKQVQEYKPSEKPSHPQLLKFSKKQKIDSKEDSKIHIKKNSFKPSQRKDYSSPRQELCQSQPGYKEEQKSIVSINLQKKNSHSEKTNKSSDQPNDSLSSNYQQKKAMKQKLAQKLREELGGVLGTSQPAELPQEGDSSVLQRDKSSRDILIKQRVEEKKKNFAELKYETMKLLTDD